MSKRVKEKINNSYLDRSKAVKREKAGKERRSVAKRKGTNPREVTSMDLHVGWDNFFELESEAGSVHAESIPDGFVKCLNNKGCVDIEYIAYITGEDFRTVIEKMRGSIYQNPDTWEECFYKGWETAEEYLSGNVRSKLATAYRENKKYHGYFQANVDALEEVIPPYVSSEDIYVTLGSPWVPESVIESFVLFLLDIDESVKVSFFKHDSKTGTWEYNSMAGLTRIYRFDHRYGTKRRKAIDILIRTLNMQSVAVYDRVMSNATKSGFESILNKEETVLAMEKQKLLIGTFREWIWNDKERKNLLENIYEEKYACLRQRVFDGSFLEFPDMDPEIELFQYQKNAIARIIFSPNTLLAHDVGSGKTYIMIAAGMELKRMGLSKKNLYVVPNNIIGQWRNFFAQMYPASRVRCIEPKDFTADKRESVLEDIRDKDYDAVIMAYSSFTMIPISLTYRKKEILREINECKRVYIYGFENRSSTEKLLRKTRKLRNKYDELTEEKEIPGVCFDQLGITRLFVDEAHNFKNVPIETKIERVMGINKTGSSKCLDMLQKVRIVQHQNEGRGVVMATATPITNSVTDAFIMQQYLQSGALAIADLESFDSWVGMFAEQTTNFEIDVDTSTYRLATRFAKFHNIPELTNMLASFADFHQLDVNQGIPDHDGYMDVVVNRTAEFRKYLERISERAEDVRHGLVNRSDDNMLKITTDGRKAALDLRLISDGYGFSTNSKVFMCAEKVAEIYRETDAKKSTQLIFCDTSTPKAAFNIYSEMERLLIRMGIPEAEIAFIHDASTEKRREKLFGDVREGGVRVLIGSTFKLGLGVNVQDKLIALHHLDVPWRPADMYQREGRIIRQGNENPKVGIYRYITEGSFDAYSWQLLETKQRFITDLLSGTATERSGAEIDDTVLNYAEVKAIAVGNPLVKKRVEASNELLRYILLQKKGIAQHEEYEQELEKLPERIKKIESLVTPTEADAAFYSENKREYSSDERRDIRGRIFKATHTEEPTREETVLLDYQGFDVVVPPNISLNHPVVYLRRERDYPVELGTSDVGGLIKIDNCLEGLGKRVSELGERLEELKARKGFIEKEVLKSVDYTEKIMECKERIAEIDERLGVDKEK